MRTDHVNPAWGNMGELGGWLETPTVIFRRRKEIGITLEELCLVQHVLQYQYRREKLPQVRIRMLADQMEVSESTVKRWKNSLVEKGLLSLKTSFSAANQRANFWDFSGLIAKVRQVCVSEETDRGGFADEPRVGSSVDPGGFTHEPPVENKDLKKEDLKKEELLGRFASASGLASDVLPAAALGFPEGGGPDARLRLVGAQYAAEIGAARSRAVHEAKIQKARQREEREKNLAGVQKPIGVKKTVLRLEVAWHEEMKKRFPELQLPKWEGKEFGQVVALVKLYDVDTIETSIRYMIRNWDRIRDRFWKSGKGGTIPGLGLLRKCHDTLVLEAQQWVQLSTVQKEWSEFFAQNPNAMSAPAELEERFRKAQRDIELLGIAV